MSRYLAPSQISGGFPISSTAPGTVVARIPADAQEPAVLTVMNRDAAATMYGKWIPLVQTNQNFQTNDAGIVLSAGDSYTWDNPPRNAMLVMLATVNNALCAVNGSWNVPGDAQLL